MAIMCTCQPAAVHRARTAVADSHIENGWARRNLRGMHRRAAVRRCRSALPKRDKHTQLLAEDLSLRYTLSPL